MDKSLDDIIKQNRTTRRPRRTNNARSQILGKKNAGTAPAARVRKAGAAETTPANTAISQKLAEKISVSGLPMDVNEAQVKELFQTTVGPLKAVRLNYDQHGKFNGTANVHFTKKGDALKAYNMYNNRLIDGKSPMIIEFLFDPGRALAPPSLASRVAPAPAAAAAAAPMEGVRRTGGRPRRGRGRGGRGARPQKSAADLDAEMEDYTASNGPAAAATAPAAAATA